VWVVAAAALLGASVAGAEVSLRGKAELEAALKNKPPCCVIDARAVAHRISDPVPEALPYKEGMTVNPAGPVVVIADTDVHAMEIGRALAGGPKSRVQVYAVMGGFATWQVTAVPDPTTTMPRSFVIPSDTCQTGPALQTLPAERP
jgi:hypothetical protein